ncbi:hypothetical protein [Pseudonocardia charpentierae]|uniref:Uncharacterized protein n=1 Tax=Pseudonocardia charpentierae TaxID=3075545 RepID=A0ABU2NN47_9PSEU|nr:hypothetical protein [Pseudonocardia sp. DSM 45834]MDT0354054.1 hypothetical protein [Pseudonocardia sp. DSM 45834]
MEPTKRSAIALGRGARTGVLMMRMSAAVRTASKAAVNLASRSRLIATLLKAERLRARQARQDEVDRYTDYLVDNGPESFLEYPYNRSKEIDQMNTKGGDAKAS